MGRSILALTMLLAMAAGASAQNAAHLDAALKKPAYRRSWNVLLEKSAPVPDWLRHFSRTMDGVTTPARAVKLSDGAYEIYTVCKPHDCGSNKLHVIFARGGAKAAGALINNNRGPRLIGDQGAEMTAALIRSFAY